MRIISFLLVIALTAGGALADIVVLKDGTRYEGEVKRNGNNWRITMSDGRVVEVPADNVKSLELTGANSPNGKPSADQATANLQSLRRSVENVADLKQIIDRYKRFIDQYKGTPAVTEAQRDVVIWQDRLDRGLVKIGSHWVSAQERSAMADKALGITDQAREMIAHGRVHDGDLMLTQALDQDPLCPPALYLRGVVLFQQHQLAASRKAFEAVATLITDHAPTLNNLAVILWMQNAAMPSLAKYESAMTAAPVNRVVLDNVAEALAIVPEDQRKNLVAQRVFRKFTEQDARLQEAMAAQGMFRWGGTWVDRATMEQFKQIEKEVNEKMITAKADADVAEKQVRAIDAQIDTLERSLRQIENDSVRRDLDGKLVRLPYPPSYYDMENQEARLKADRVTAVSKATTARALIKSLQAQLPKPKFTGAQQIVGAEGAPIMLAPATQESQHDAAPVPGVAPTPASAGAPATTDLPSNEPPRPEPQPNEPPATQPVPAVTIPAPAWPSAPASQPATQPTTQHA